MQVFELYFNPKAKKNTIFDTFYYEPENIYEKRLGHLFMAGKLSNVLPQNLRFLKNLAQVLQNKFYSLGKYSTQSSLKQSLKEANSFLDKIAKQGDVSWIASLNFAVLLLSPESSSKTKVGKYKLNFTRVGDFKIFLARAGKLLDIGKNLELTEIEPYPLRIFSDIFSGRLKSEDRIFVLSKELGEEFLSEGLLEKLASLPVLSEKSIGQIFQACQTATSGILLLIDPEKPKEKRPGKKIVFKEKFRPALPSFKIPSFGLKFLLQKPFQEFIKRASVFSFFSLKNLAQNLIQNKKVFLVLSLVFFLFLASLIAKIEEKQQISQTQLILKEIRTKMDQAESLLLLEESDKANLLLLEAWEKIQPLIKSKNVLGSQISSLKEELEQKLSQLNKLEKIEEPKLIFEFPKGQFLAQRIFLSQGQIYFFSPFSPGLFVLEKEQKIHQLPIDQKIFGAAQVEEKILFFSKPLQLFLLENNHLKEIASLKPPFENFELDNFFSFYSHLYFIEKNSNQVIKYQHQANFNWQTPKSWLKEETKELEAVISMAIDGSIWIQREKNIIEQYQAGRLQKTIEKEVFPMVKKLTKIWTASTLPYLYILEPDQKRIIILNKEGKVIKQYQSEKFDNLKDFAVSEDGKEIYLLNGPKLYQINL